MSFAEATAVTREGLGHYTGTIQPGWDIRGVSNGGYLMAIAGRAMAAETDGRRVVSMTGHFVNPGRPGPIDIDVQELKSGRTFTTLRSVMTAEGKPLLSVTGSLSSVGGVGNETSLLQGSPPELPPPDECVKATPSETGEFPPPLTSKIDLRIHPEDVGGTLGNPTGSALFRGWFGLPGEERVDDLAIVLASDSFPPAIFNAGLPMTWTPTLDLTVHVRDPGPHEWLMCSLQTRFVTGGFLEEDGEIWDSKGNLVALSRQLAVVGR